MRHRLIFFEFFAFSSIMLVLYAFHFISLVGLILLLPLLLIFLYVFDLQNQKKINLLKAKEYLAETKTKEEQLLFDTLFGNTNIGTAVLHLDGRFHRVNKSICELLGYTEDELKSLNFFYLIHASDLNKLKFNLQSLFNKKVKEIESEQQCFNHQGENIWILSKLSLVNAFEAKPSYLMLQLEDLTEKKKAEERFRHMAYHDPLTGLANRNKLEQFITHMLMSAKRHQQSFAILFLDLDGFKNINDTLGHEAGDTLLQVVAERLRSVIRNTDMVARLGGDEFVLLITDVKKAESAAVIAKKILQSILEVITIKGQEIYVTTSIGISIYPYDGQTMQTLMKNADLAMYRAKEHGRNNYQFYTLEMTSRAQEKMSLQNALAHALVKEEFILHYLPKMELKTRKITGVEALLRWKNKEFGMITPDEIIGLAEETGLIIPVSEWVFKTACKQLKRWHEMGFNSLTMAVNCSARQFKQSSFIEDVKRLTSEMGVTPKFLEIEVTESTIMQDPDNMLRVLYSLKDMGFQIAIDDFGTGYWSLGNLRRLSVDRIKIDKTFIKNIMQDETSTVLTSAMIAMVNKLGIKAVAEGVETKAQYEFLSKEECAEIQGYYLTRPLPEDAMTAFLEHPTPEAEMLHHNDEKTP